jgi:hypothetical protein
LSGVGANVENNVSLPHVVEEELYLPKLVARTGIAAFQVL